MGLAPMKWSFSEKAVNCLEAAMPEAMSVMAEIH
jgi:hypothetical protein